jgi:hypothetical protein
VQTIHARHGDVEDDDVEVGVLHRQRPHGVSDLQHDGVRAEPSEQGGETVADDRMIVDHQEFHIVDYGMPKRPATRGGQSCSDARS